MVQLKLITTDIVGSELKCGQMINLLGHIYKVAIAITEDKPQGIANLVPGLTASMQPNVTILAHQTYKLVSDEDALALVPKRPTVVNGSSNTQTNVDMAAGQDARTGMVNQTLADGAHGGDANLSALAKIAEAQKTQK